MPIKPRRQRRFDQKMSEALKAERKRIDAIRSMKVPTHSHAVVRGLTPRLSASVDSWCRRRVPLHLTMASGFEPTALTDFKSIVVKVPDSVSPTGPDVDWFANLRGLVYHETGHILYTIPYITLRDLWQADHPGEVINENDRVLHHCWNIMEDQRMETRMVAESANLARYFTALATNWINVNDGGYMLLAGRLFLPRDLRAKARALFDDWAGSPGCADKYDRVLGEYMAATDPSEMFNCVLRMAKLFGPMMTNKGQNAPGQHQDNGYEDSQDRYESMKGAPKKAENGAVTDAIPQMAETADEQPDTPQTEAGLDSLRQELEELVKEASEQARADRATDGALHHDEKAYNQAKQSAAGKGMPAPLRQGVPNRDPEALVQAQNLQRALLVLLQQNRARVAPVWSRNQRTGVLDVIRYKTRQPGDHEYRKFYAPEGDLDLPDLAVSVVLDGSGSMMGSIDDLSIAAFAMKKSCEAVQVPCTVTVFSDGATILWEPEDEPTAPPLDFTPNGGTQPLQAMRMVAAQRHDRKRHLVVIMTDGDWDSTWHESRRGSDVNSLSHFAGLNTDMVMFFYRTQVRQSLSGLDTLSSYHSINDLSEMPKFLTRYLIQSFGAH